MPKAAHARPSLRTAQKDMTRRRIMDAARKLFSTLSFEQVSMEDVAGEAEIGRTTIYFHYPTKNALLIDLLREDWDRQAILFEMLADSPQVNRDSLRQWLGRLAAGMRKSRPLFRLYGFTLSLNNEVGEYHAQHRERLISTLSRRLPAFQPQGKEGGSFKAAAASQLMIVQIEFYGALLAAEPSEGEAEAATEAILDNLEAFVGVLPD